MNAIGVAIVVIWAAVGTIIGFKKYSDYRIAGDNTQTALIKAIPYGIVSPVIIFVKGLMSIFGG